MGGTGGAMWVGGMGGWDVDHWGLVFVSCGFGCKVIVWNILC